MSLDLRFIPDEMSFERTPRDAATTLPPRYSAPSFSSSALQQSKVRLSQTRPRHVHDTSMTCP